MNINKVEFPLYKLRSYISIDKNPLGIIRVQTIKGNYVLDDQTYNGTFEERRLKIQQNYAQNKIYKLKERVLYLRQLVKYKSGTIFIDNSGSLIKYTKSSKLYTIKSHKITKKRPYQNWTILNVDNIEIPFIIGSTVLPTTTHVSIMHTKEGPFLYDLTNKWHEPYKRKI